MIENYLLEQFVAFAECGTLLKASGELHISQPSLSRSMKKLEEELGVSLFHRENSKISLNETGMVAAEYARRALGANQEMIDHVISFDRSLRTVFIGSCAPLPINDLMPTLQERMPGKTISAEIASDIKLLSGLRNRSYQLAILHEEPGDKSIFCQRFMEEQLYISIDIGHALAKEKSVSFEDLKDLRILMDGNVGFWNDVCREMLSPDNLLIQSSFDAFSELVQASRLPLFNSSQFLARGYHPPGRVSIPIADNEAHATYYLSCLVSEQKKYRSVFNATRGNLITGSHIQNNIQ
ncbi:MAG: LysR family transcriptional regulator [Mogibacterium sp.]|nr:LysR family transcriptional regulator [Mogibacterium sp.]